MAEEIKEKAEETKEKIESQKPKNKHNIPWMLLTYTNILLFVGIMIYLAINISNKYMVLSEPVKKIRDWDKNTARFEPFIVNLANNDISYILKVSIQLEPDKYLLFKEVNNSTPKIRDIIISILTQKKYEEIRDNTNKDKLKKEILKYVNVCLDTGRFKKVYFTEFVVK